MEANQIVSILSKQCARLNTARIITSDLGLICQARFSSLSAESVLLELLDPPETAYFRPLSLFVVSFNSGSRHCIFLSSVIHFKQDKQEEELQTGQLLLRIPSDIIAAESRIAFRVPLGHDTELRARVVDENGKTWAPQPLDISMTGILIEFPANDVPGFQIDDRLQVELRMNDHVAQLEGFVRRCEGRGYGLIFPEVLRGADFDPPAALRAIVNTLERTWLRSRFPRGSY